MAFCLCFCLPLMIIHARSFFAQPSLPCHDTTGSLITLPNSCVGQKMPTLNEGVIISYFFISADPPASPNLICFCKAAKYSYPRYYSLVNPLSCISSLVTRALSRGRRRQPRLVLIMLALCGFSGI